MGVLRYGPSSLQRRGQAWLVYEEDPDTQACTPRLAHGGLAALRLGQTGWVRGREQEEGPERARLPPQSHPVSPGLPTRTVHLALVRQDDLASAAGWVDGQGLLKALLDVWAPHALRVIVQPLVQALGPILPGLPGAAAGVPAVGRYCAGYSGLWA